MAASSAPQQRSLAYTLIVPLHRHLLPALAMSLLVFRSVAWGALVSLFDKDHVGINPLP